MSEAFRVSSDPTGEARPRSHKYVPNQARRGPVLSRDCCDAPSVVFTGLREVPNPLNRRILAMRPSPSGESRVKRIWTTGDAIIAARSGLAARADTAAGVDTAAQTLLGRIPSG
jgi:hypothetical protein